MHKQLSDEELRTLLSEYQREGKKAGKKLVIAGVLVVLGILGVMLCMFAGAGAFAILFGALLVAGIVLIFTVRGSSKGGEAERAIEEAILLPALQEIFDTVEYDRNKRISWSSITESGMYPVPFDSSNGNDLITGVYKGLRVKMSDIRLFQSKEHWDAEKEEYVSESKQVFCGLWMICDFNKALSADVRLMERRGMAGLMKDTLTKNSTLLNRIGEEKSDIETENALFNKKFAIHTDNAHDAFYVLTPHMMEFIMNMDERANGDTYMRFARNGKVHVAVNSGRDAFRLSNNKDWSDVEQLRAQFTAEIRYMTDLIDELRLTDGLFRQPSSGAAHAAEGGNEPCE